MLDRKLRDPYFEFQECIKRQTFTNPILLGFLIPHRTTPWSKHYARATINNGFIRVAKITEQWYPMIPTKHLLENLGLLSCEPFFINVLLGTIIIRIRCIHLAIYLVMVIGIIGHVLLRTICIHITYITGTKFTVKHIAFILIILLFRWFTLVICICARRLAKFMLGHRILCHLIMDQGNMWLTP